VNSMVKDYRLTIEIYVGKILLRGDNEKAGELMEAVSLAVKRAAMEALKDIPAGPVEVKAEIEW